MGKRSIIQVFIHPSFHLSIHPTIFILIGSSTHTSVHAPIHPFIHPANHPPTHSSLHLSICLSIHLSFQSPIIHYLSLNQFFHPSISFVYSVKLSSTSFMSSVCMLENPSSVPDIVDAQWQDSESDESGFEFWSYKLPVLWPWGNLFNLSKLQYPYSSRRVPTKPQDPWGHLCFTHYWNLRPDV